jgi:DNA (cytosine-5)-methyltransferase 1
MIRVFTAFSGYDSQCLALDRLKRDFPTFDYELVGWAEIDKYAIQAHNALYPQWADRNYGDISKIDWDDVPDFDLFTYSSPCQDFSNAGLQRGGEEGSGTRSSLLWECRRAIIAKRPKYLLLENVAALVSQKFLPLFNKWQAELERYGYTNFARVLNAKDYGVPQNRERIFMISILDREASYHFPEPFKLEKRLKDVLEQNVDEKYYLSDLSIAKIRRNTGKEDPAVDVMGSAKTVCASLNKITTFDNYIKDV